MVEENDYRQENNYRQWLASMINNRQSYHNHKETMAWVITALYVPGIVYLGYIESQIRRGAWEVLVGVLIFLAWFCVWKFVRMQFYMRWKEADIIAVLMQRLAKLNGGAKPPLPKEWTIEEKINTPITLNIWPKFIQCKIDQLKTERKCKEAFKALWKFSLSWLYFVFKWIYKLSKKIYKRKENTETRLPKWVLFWRRDPDKDDPRWKTEIPSYILILIATVFSICLAVCN